MTTSINNTYTFSITSDDVNFVGVHPKSGLQTISVQGSCTSPDGDVYDFVATNNLDMRYPCLLYTSPSPRDATLSRMPSSA